jgi:hypothetical protein
MAMKKIMLAALLACTGAIAFAQSAAEIIEQHIAARGGREKLAGIKTIYMEGVREMMGAEVPVRIYKEQDKLSRTEFDAAGSTGFSLITTTGAWNLIPMRSPTPTPMGAEAVANMQTELDIAGPLLNYSDKGHKAELVGTDSVNGMPCYHIKLTLKDGRERNFFIAVSNLMLLKTTAKFTRRAREGAENAQPQTGENATLYADYKAVDGIMFAHSISMQGGMGGRGGGGGGETIIDKIEINKPIDAKLYKPE